MTRHRITNWFLVSLFGLLGTVVFTSCKKIVTEYYLVRISMPRIIEKNGKIKTTDLKVELEHLQAYPNDSTAIRSEKKRADDFFYNLPADREKTIAEQINPADDDMIAEMKKRAICEAYDDLAEQKLVLLRMRYDEGTDFEAYLNLVKENGIVSEKARQFATDHNIDVFFYTLKE